mgnify:FL=1
MKKIFLCDGHNLAFRAFYGIRELTRRDGFPTNMIHGWLRTFWHLTDNFSPDEIWVFFDLGGCVKREKILPEYKANRGLPPEDFSKQLAWLKKITISLGHGMCEEEGREADDLIASKVAELDNKNEIVIVSADKDLGQLVKSGVSQLLPPPTANPKIGWRILDEKGVEEKFGIPPCLLLDYLSIIGDQADNINGLKGVGPKTAVKWLKNWGNLDEIILNAGRITPARFGSLIYENRDLLNRNRDLIKLDNAPLNCVLEPKDVDLIQLEEILAEMEMTKSIVEARKRYL